MKFMGRATDGVRDSARIESAVGPELSGGLQDEYRRDSGLLTTLPTFNFSKVFGPGHLT
jgi:hypothetical protein